MFNNYSSEEKLRRIDRIKELLSEYRAILNKDHHLTCQQAYHKLKEKYGVDCPCLRTLSRWKKHFPSNDIL